MTARRKILSSLLAATAFLALPAAANTWPSRPIKFIVPLPPGGTADATARILAAELSRTLGKEVVVENRAGASGQIGHQALLAAPADGHTILSAGLLLATNPALLKNLGYDAEKDIVMVAQTVSLPVVVLAPGNSPLNDLRDLVEASKKKPGGLAFSSGGVGTSAHLGPELFSRVMGIQYTHIPFRGGAPALQALLAGDTEVGFDTGVNPAMRSNVAAGRLKFLGVMQAEPLAVLPGVKSAGQQGIPASAFVSSWIGIGVKRGTPPEIITKLHQHVNMALSRPEIAEKLRANGTDPTPSASPAEFQRLFESELARWTKLIREAGITVD